ncbi:hypothetical protein CB1_000443006 [Camelus ferus]|nr:hypothetical protein CB1_000443006 [Camelus ferus]
MGSYQSHRAWFLESSLCLDISEGADTSTSGGLPALRKSVDGARMMARGVEGPPGRVPAVAYTFITSSPRSRNSFIHSAGVD